MGIFEFVREAGSALGTRVYDLSHDERGVTAPVVVSKERINERRQRDLQRQFAALALDTGSVQVSIGGDTVILTGSVPDQETCEKLTLAAGNHRGISQVDCQLKVAKSEPEATFYTVKAGDSLGKIALAHYGSAAKFVKIFEANQPLLDDPRRIYPGQKLRLPVLLSVGEESIASTQRDHE